MHVALLNCFFFIGNGRLRRDTRLLGSFLLGGSIERKMGSGEKVEKFFIHRSSGSRDVKLKERTSIICK